MLLASLATSAYFFAQGTTSLVASKLFGIDLDEESAARPAQRARPTASPSRRTVSANGILERNIFEPPAPPSPDAGVPGAEAAAALPPIDIHRDNAPPCAADLRVLGAVVNPAVPAWSYAALAQGTTAAILYRIGQSFGGKTVYLIDSGPDLDPDAPRLPGGQERLRVRVVLQEGNGNLCQMSMFQPPAAAQGATTAAAAPGATPATAAAAPPASGVATAPSGEIATAELDQGIVRVSDSQFTVNRGLMERALSQQDSLFRSARLIPNEANGAIDGMKIYGVRRSSLLGRLGIQNGDILRDVNGQTMQSADALMQAYQLLGRNGSFSINVTRHGNPVTLTYQVQ